MFSFWVFEVNSFLWNLSWFVIVIVNREFYGDWIRRSEVPGDQHTYSWESVPVLLLVIAVCQVGKLSYSVSYLDWIVWWFCVRFLFFGLWEWQVLLLQIGCVFVLSRKITWICSPIRLAGRVFSYSVWCSVLFARYLQGYLFCDLALQWQGDRVSYWARNNPWAHDGCKLSAHLIRFCRSSSPSLLILWIWPLWLDFRV